MKVLKKGTKPIWSKEVICSGAGNIGIGCGALLLISEGDIFQTMSHCRDETSYYDTIQCPECEVLTDVDGVSANLVRIKAPKGIDGGVR